MSEESSTGAQGTAPPEGEPVPSPGEPQPSASATDALGAETDASPLLAPRPRWLWRLRRTSLRVRVVAALVATAVIAAVVLVTLRPSSLPSAQQIKYTGMPTPCEVLTSASLAKYLPGATSTQQGESVGTVSHVGTCNWDSLEGGQSRSLSVTLVVYETSSWLSDAEYQYQALVSDESGIMGKGATLSVRPVADLGDQAMSMVVTGHNPSPGETLAPQVGLVVRSGNADILLNYSTVSLGSATLPTIADQVAGTIAMARDVLAALAR